MEWGGKPCNCLTALNCDFAGIPPFNADTPEEIFDNILDRRITWPDEEDMSPECRDLIDKLLQPNPLKRFGHRGAGEKLLDACLLTLFS